MMNSLFSHSLIVTDHVFLNSLFLLVHTGISFFLFFHSLNVPGRVRQLGGLVPTKTWYQSLIFHIFFSFKVCCSMTLQYSVRASCIRVTLDPPVVLSASPFEPPHTTQAFYIGKYQIQKLISVVNLGVNMAVQLPEVIRKAVLYFLVLCQMGNIEMKEEGHVFLMDWAKEQALIGRVPEVKGSIDRYNSTESSLLTPFQSNAYRIEKTAVLDSTQTRTQTRRCGQKMSDYGGGRMNIGPSCPRTSWKKVLNPLAPSSGLVRRVNELREITMNYTFGQLTAIAVPSMATWVILKVNTIMRCTLAPSSQSRACTTLIMVTRCWATRYLSSVSSSSNVLWRDAMPRQQQFAFRVSVASAVARNV